MILTPKSIKAILLVQLLIALLVLGCKSDTTSKREMDTRPSLFEMLQEIDPLKVTIETDIEAYIDKKDSVDANFQDALMTITHADGTTTDLNIEVRPRGVTRKELCDFPPMMIKAPRVLREELNLRKTDHIKLVTYCKNEDGFQNLVMKEMLNYKLFGLLSDYSYQAKMTSVRYVDSNRNFETIEKTGFMIEPTDAMAGRLGCTLVDKEAAVKTIYKEHYKKFVVFQYMIGNTDWNLSARHNIRLLKCDADKGPIPVPYDFDYSGLVNAPYAKPHPMFSIKAVTDRLFQWRGSAEEDFSDTYAQFLENKDGLYNLCNTFPLLDDKTKNEITSYLDQFFANINSQEKMTEEIMKVRKK